MGRFNNMCSPIVQDYRIWSNVTIGILEEKSVIKVGNGKVVDSSPNDHIFIYTHTMVALKFLVHNFPFVMDFKTFTKTFSWN